MLKYTSFYPDVKQNLSGMELDFIKFPLMLKTIQKYAEVNRVEITGLVLKLLYWLTAYNHEQFVARLSAKGRGKYGVLYFTCIILYKTACFILAASLHETEKCCCDKCKLLGFKAVQYGNVYCYPVKCWRTYLKLHNATTQMVLLFTITATSTSNPMSLLVHMYMKLL
jgi:hypothetical protein